MSFFRHLKTRPPRNDRSKMHACDILPSNTLYNKITEIYVLQGQGDRFSFQLQLTNTVIFHCHWQQKRRQSGSCYRCFRIISFSFVWFSLIFLARIQKTVSVEPAKYYSTPFRKVHIGLRGMYDLDIFCGICKTSSCFQWVEIRESQGQSSGRGTAGVRKFS